MQKIDQYICNHTDPEPPHLQKLDRDANICLMNPRMNSGHLQGRFLAMISKIIKPTLALEIGTFGGYSAQCIAEGIADGGKLITIEIDDEREDFILSHLHHSPHANKIELCIGNALQIMPQLKEKYGAESFQLIFLDADKRLYTQFYHQALTLLAPEGLLIADNVLWDGHVAETTRHDPMTTGIREFNDMIASDATVEKIMLPLRDGLLLIRKKKTV